MVQSPTVSVLWRMSEHAWTRGLSLLLPRQRREPVRRRERIERHLEPEGSKRWSSTVPGRFHTDHKGIPACLWRIIRARESKSATNGPATLSLECPWVPLSKHARALRLSERPKVSHPAVRSMSVGFFHPDRIPGLDRSSTRVETDLSGLLTRCWGLPLLERSTTALLLYVSQLLRIAVWWIRDNLLGISPENDHSVR